MDLKPLYSLIKTHEGLRLTPYKCPAGKPTIGLGTTIYPDGRKVTMDDKAITEHQAWAYAKAGIDDAVRAALKYSPNLHVRPNKLCAIADFIYNLGAGNYKGSTLKTQVNKENWEQAAVELLRWVHCNGKRLPGLVLRRKAEARLLLA